MRICIISHESTHEGALCFTLRKRACVQAALFHDLQQIHFAEFDLVIYTAFLPATVVRELQIPASCKRKDIPGSVEYQFVRALPLDADAESCWEFLRFHFPRENMTIPIRAAVVSTDVFQEKIQELKQRKAQFDYFLLPQLLFDKQFFPGCEHCVPPRKQEILNYFNENDVPGFPEFKRECSQRQISDPAIQTSLFMARQFLCAVDGRMDLYMSPGMQTEELRPARCRTLKRINLFLSIFLIVCICALAARNFKQSWSVYEQLERENQRLSRQIKDLQKETLQANNEIQLLQRYDELNPGLADLRPVLQEISQRIPSYMWVDSFRFSNGMLDLSVKSEKDDINFFKKLKEGVCYKLVNLRKNRTSHGKTEYSVTLRVEDL